MPSRPWSSAPLRSSSTGAREIEHWLPHRSVTVVSGTGTVAESAEITVINYDIVHAHRARLALRRPAALVLDESHYVKNPRAKRTQAVRRLAEGLGPDALRLALTGTPVMNHAEELIPQLRVLGRLEDFGSGARFARRFQGAGAEERIHWHLRRRCFVRRLKADVLPQLPAKRQVVVPVALDNEREYRQAEHDVVAWLREQPLDLGELEARVAAALRAERLAQLNASSASPRAARRGPRWPGSTTSWPRTSRWSCSAATAKCSNSCWSGSRTRCTCSAATRSSSVRPPSRRSRTRPDRS